MFWQKNPWMCNKNKWHCFLFPSPEQKKALKPRRKQPPSTTRITFFGLNSKEPARLWRHRSVCSKRLDFATRCFEGRSVSKTYTATRKAWWLGWLGHWGLRDFFFRRAVFFCAVSVVFVFDGSWWPGVFACFGGGVFWPEVNDERSINWISIVGGLNGLYILSLTFKLKLLPNNELLYLVIIYLFGGAKDTDACLILLT